MSCIVVFGRQPVPGRVKTRLASAIGANAAADIYAALLNHTLAVAAATGKEVVLSLADEIRDGWRPPPGAKVELQGEGGLGDRMAESFNRRFAEGRRRVVIIGSDCAELSPERLNLALDLLATHRVVLGPATDGGYWAVGQRSPGVEMFESVPWSTPQTLDRTRRVLQSLGVGWHELDTLSDLDTVADLDRHLTAGGVPPVLTDRLRRAVSQLHDRDGA
jgi:rSAM/selenodomain-associated transferase 1